MLPTLCSVLFDDGQETIAKQVLLVLRPVQVAGRGTCVPQVDDSRERDCRRIALGAAPIPRRSSANVASMSFKTIRVAAPFTRDSPLSLCIGPIAVTEVVERGLMASTLRCVLWCRHTGIPLANKVRRVACTISQDLGNAGDVARKSPEAIAWADEVCTMGTYNREFICEAKVGLRPRKATVRR